MKTLRKIPLWVAMACVTVLAGLALALPAAVRAVNINPPVFDFSDAFYVKNGVDIQKVNAVGGGRPNGFRVGFDGADAPGSIENGAKAPPGVGHWIVDNSNTDPTRTNTRVMQTTGGFDKDGDLIYYSILSPLPDESFLLHDSLGNLTKEGQDAFNLAEKFRAFLFPVQRKGGQLLTNLCPPEFGPPTPGAQNCVVSQPPPVNRRQDNLFETTDTYSCRNLLGLWLLTFVVYTDAAFNTPAGQQALAALAATNGNTTDGTPVFKRLNEILDFQTRGFVQLVNPPGPFASSRPAGSAPRWVV